MAKHPEFQDGYQAAMADIKAILDSSYEDGIAHAEDIRDAFDRVTEWVTNNTPSGV